MGASSSSAGAGGAVCAGVLAIELCCLGADLVLPRCDASLVETFVVHAEEAEAVTTPLPRASAAQLGGRPVRLFGAFVEAVARVYLGGSLDRHSRYIWQALESSGNATRELCPVAHALSKLLRAELALAALLSLGGSAAWRAVPPSVLARKDGFVSAAHAVTPSCATSRALLSAGHRRIAVWEAALAGRLHTGSVTLPMPARSFVHSALSALLADAGDSEWAAPLHVAVGSTPPLQVPDSEFLEEWPHAEALPGRELALRGAVTESLDVLEDVQLVFARRGRRLQYWPRGRTLIGLLRHGALEGELAGGRRDLVASSLDFAVGPCGEAEFVDVVVHATSAFLSRGWHGCYLNTPVSEVTCETSSSFRSSSFSTPSPLDAERGSASGRWLTCVRLLGGTVVRGDVHPLAWTPDEDVRVGAGADGIQPSLPAPAVCSAYGRQVRCTNWPSGDLAAGWGLRDIGGQGKCFAIPEHTCSAGTKAMQEEDVMALSRTWADLEVRGFANMAPVWAKSDECRALQQKFIECVATAPHSEPSVPAVNAVSAQQDKTLTLEVGWLGRRELRWGPNPLCWTSERRDRGVTPEACCGEAGDPEDFRAPASCWDGGVFRPWACCHESNNCGDLVLTAAVIGSSQLGTDDPLRDFHRQAARLASWAKRSPEPLRLEDGDRQFAPLWAIVSGWPDEDLRERCPEVWLILQIMEAVLPGSHETTDSNGRGIDDLRRVFHAHRESFTDVAGLLLDVESRPQDVSSSHDTSRPQTPEKGDAIDLAYTAVVTPNLGDTSDAEAVTEAGAEAVSWRETLRLCERGICGANRVEEDAIVGAACGAIPVGSEQGGIGRTTTFGRVLWCAARVGEGTVLDLYAGGGDTATLMADGLRGRPPGSRRLILSFEHDSEAAMRTVARLRFQGVAVRDVRFHERGERPVVADEVLSAAAWHPPEDRVGAVIFVGSSSTPMSTLMTKDPRSALSLACGAAGGIGLALLDPDVEMSPHMFAEDWRALERHCGPPRLVAIYNTNLPGGAGWVRERLLRLGTYIELLGGHHDGGHGEEDEFRKLRAWSLLLCSARSSAPVMSVASSTYAASMDASAAGRSGTSRPHRGLREEEPGDDDAIAASEQVVDMIQAGASWTMATFRPLRGGAVTKVHETVAKDLVPVEMQRPTSELLTPPGADTNPHLCFAEGDERPTARTFRIPCFLSCEGPSFHSAWTAFRRSLAGNERLGYPVDEDLFVQANSLLDGIYQNDSALIIGRSRFMSRLRHEFTHDEHLGGFCLYGIACALFVRARHWLELEPREFVNRGKRVSAPKVALDDLEIAFSILSDSNTKAGIEFSFLESSAWPVRLEDIISNLEAQRTSLGAPFVVLTLEMQAPPAPAAGCATTGDAGHGLPIESGSAPPGRPPLRLCGVGDHLTATFDAILMVEQALRTAGARELRVEREMLGRFCPLHKGQRHQCLQRCQLLGIGCGSGDEDKDPIASWLGGIIHAETLEELYFDLAERTAALAGIVRSDARLLSADLHACSHPTVLCILLADVVEVPIFVHASSTLLYGLPCRGCSSGSHSTLRFYSSDDVHRYLRTTQRLIGGVVGTTDGRPIDNSGLAESRKRLVFVAEGRFLAEQIRRQVQVEVPWMPPLALYTQGRWAGGSRRNALVLRSRFFITLMGELMRSLLREVASINGVAMEVTFLGADNQFDEQWVTLEEIASYGAAVLYPNDVHQRTFHEVYVMGVPLFVPDALGLYRAQRAANWGYASYGCAPMPRSEAELDATELLAKPGNEPASGASAEPWWNSFGASPEVVVPFQQLADWEQLPYVQRFGSVPGLLDAVATANLQLISQRMIAFHRQLSEDALLSIAGKVLAALKGAGAQVD